jgi:outer membrane protein OmpA-like peptidoglycan-associated protein
VRLVVALTLLELAACAASRPRPAAPAEVHAPPALANAPAKPSGPAPANAPAKSSSPVPANDAGGPSIPDPSPPGPLAPGSVAGVPEIPERIFFDDGAAVIAPPSFPLLDSIAAAIKLHPETFPLVALDGHAAPNEPKPMRLSLARATAVRLALIERGVDGARLFERVSGATTVPLCEHSRDICWERERRVEFAILHPAKSPDAKAAAPERPAPPGDDHPASVAARCPAKPGSGDGAEDAEVCPKQEPAAAGPARPNLLEQVTFARGSAVLTPSVLPALDLVAGFLKANPTSLEIAGYAAEGERGPTELARARAEAVRAYLIACGVSAGGLVVRAPGTEKPACRERTSACRARNRRAELRVIDAHP